MKIALEKACAGGPIGRAVDFWCGSNGFCHGAILLSSGWELSSFPSPRRGPGFWLRPHPPTGWRIYDLGFDDQEQRIREWVTPYLNAGYDYWGVLHFVPIVRHFVRPHPTRWWCTELVTAIVQELGMWKHVGDQIVTPDALDFMCAASDLPLLQE